MPIQSYRGKTLGGGRLDPPLGIRRVKLISLETQFGKKWLTGIFKVRIAAIGSNRNTNDYRNNLLLLL